MAAEKDYWEYYSEEYQKVLESQIATTKPPNTEPKKTFWETGFGTGLSSLWGFFTNNPQQVIDLVGQKRSNDPTLPPIYVPQQPQPQPQTQQGGNNTIILVIMGVVIVVILFLMFRKQ